MNTGKDSSTGKCQFCKQTFTRKEIAGHLESCELRKPFLQEQIEKSRPQKAGIFHLLVEGHDQTDYWLYLDVRADSTFRDLDHFLRDIWLECCGHLSAFTIEEKIYLSQLFEEPAVWGPRPEEYDMEFELKDVLRPRLKFLHDYDFGTTTRLGLKVLSYREGEIRGKKVQLLARNDPPLILCDVCRHRKARIICTECMWKDDGWLCEGCAQAHECDEDMFLPVVNSPRTGMCGYEGSFWADVPKTLKDDDLCHCGSGKEYIKCCWIRDVMRKKREKPRISFEELKEATRDKVFMSRDETQSFADDIMDKYNREPDEDFLGLSSKQIYRLLHFPIEQNKEIVQLNKKLPPKFFEKAPIVCGTLFFLSELAKVEPLKATAKGNLPLKFARLLFDEIDNSRFKEWIRFRSEENSRTVLTLRHVLRMAGWIKKEKKKFKLTRKGHGVLAGDFSEQDFFHLLQIYTQKYNWGFNDLYPEFWVIQGGWFFSLFILKKRAKTFTEDVIISRAFIKAFPEIALEVDATYVSNFEYITHCYSYRLLENFCEYFGFVQTRREKKEKSFSERLFVKTSPLFNQYFNWNVS